MKHRESQSLEWAGKTFLAAVFILFLTATSARAALDTTSPIGFFTNVASRLLRTDLNLEFTCIQIYPTNQYTPAAHRVLQVAANLYEATTNRADLTDYPYLPHVYRPILRRGTNDDIFIVGYREVRNAQIAGVGGSAPIMVDLEIPTGFTGRAAIPLMGTPYNPDSLVETDEPMAYGVPLVIGAKKGFPNFNKFGLQNNIQVTRKLQFQRQPGGPVYRTNQIHEVSISSFFGAQAWNSYTNGFPYPLQIILAADMTMSMTNSFGTVVGPGSSPLTNTFSASGISGATPWPAYVPQTTQSFLRPLFSNRLFLTNSFYLQDGTPGGTRFVSGLTPQWDQPNTYHAPHFWLNLRTRLRFIITTADRIVDYANLDTSESPLDIMEAVRNDAPCDQIINDGATDGGLLWCTNRVGDPFGTQPDDPTRPTYGILNQMLISLGVIDVSPSFWMKFSVAGVKGDSVANFAEWFNGTNAPNNYDAPFQAFRRFYQYVSWEANDPLVHYTIPDLTDLLIYPNKYELDSPQHSPTNNLLSGVNRLNRRYLPWPTLPPNYSTSPQTQFATEVKDALMKGSDNWNFPASEPLSFANLGRIHRGTPWQTIYLKSSDIDSDTWSKWSGNADLADAMAARPLNDRHLVNLFDLLVNTNNPHQRLSINTANTNAWLATLDGLSVFSNFPPDLEIIVASNSPEAAIVADGINQTRASQPHRYFRSLGDILETPELSLDSPWLDTNLLASVSTTLTDVICERLASQLLPLLRADSVGVIHQLNGAQQVEFTGYDGYPYAIEVSSNLINWNSVSTNYPVNGVFQFDAPATPDAQKFYRSRW